MMLTRNEVAERLGVSVRTVDRRIKEGKLRALKMSRGSTRITEDDLQAFIETSKYSWLLQID